MKRTRIVGNQATGLLKIIALALMFCDHAGKMLCNNSTGMRVIGRLAMPIYAWCMVVGANYTRSMPKYILRVLLCFAISQPIYMVALNHPWNEPNVLLTLALGLCALWGLREKRWLSQYWAPILAMVAATLLHADYGWRGVMLMVLLWYVRDSRSGITAVMTAFCLYWGLTSTNVTQIFGVSLRAAFNSPLKDVITPWLRMQSFAVLSLPFLLLRFPKDVKLPAWVGYGLYPFHLLLLITMEGQMLHGGWHKVLGRFTTLVWAPAQQLFIDLGDQIVALFSGL